jgi:cytochrome c-type biogenesis protein CcmE
MSPKQKRRMTSVVLVLVGVSAAVALGLSAFRENLMYFYSPTEVAEGKAPLDHMFRLGGLVEDGTVAREEEDGLTIRFNVTDTAHSVAVVYTGLLPDLFREGQGVVTHGRIGSDGVFRAERLLAKHDENYMSPEVKRALDAAGYDHTTAGSK